MHGSRKGPAVSGMHIRRAANGGFVVRHEYDNSNAGPSYMLPTEHVFKHHRDLQTHVTTHFGGAPPEAPTQKPAPTVAEGKRAANKRGGGVD